MLDALTSPFSILLLLSRLRVWPWTALISYFEFAPNSLQASMKIVSIFSMHPLFDFIYQCQRRAEEFEESHGNPVPVDGYEIGDCVEHKLNDLSMPYSALIGNIPDELLSCVADKDKFQEFVQIVNGEILSFIKSPSGSSQLWEVVRLVSFQKGYISTRCKRRQFSELLAVICHEAGYAKQLYQNMQKYCPDSMAKENDFRAIVSKFKTQN